MDAKEARVQPLWITGGNYTDWKDSSYILGAWIYGICQKKFSVRGEMIEEINFNI